MLRGSKRIMGEDEDNKKYKKILENIRNGIYLEDDWHFLKKFMKELQL